MLILTVPEMEALLIVVAATLVALLLTTAWYLHQQEQDIHGLRAENGDLWADLDAAWEALAELHARVYGGDDGPPPPDDDPDPDDGGPPTVEAHPADTWSRKLGTLPQRYAHHGQHRG